MKYKIKSRINILSKIGDIFIITFTVLIFSAAAKDSSFLHKIKYLIFTAAMTWYSIYIIIERFLFYKTLKITHYEYIFYYPFLRKEVVIKKSDVEKIDFDDYYIRSKLFFIGHYYRIYILTKNKKYYISNRDYRNFKEIVNNMKSRLPKGKIKEFTDC